MTSISNDSFWLNDYKRLELYFKKMHDAFLFVEFGHRVSFFASNAILYVKKLMFLSDKCCLTTATVFFAVVTFVGWALVSALNNKQLPQLLIDSMSP